MTLLDLFLTFLKISFFTIGGGAAMVPIIQQEILSRGIMSEEMLLNIIAIAESTPGPIAINMATYVGSVEGGIAGAICATIGMVLPPFVIILIIAKFFTNILNHRFVTGAIEGVKPVIVGLITSVGIYFTIKVMLPNFAIGAPGAIDWRAFGLFFALCFCEIGFYLYKKKTPSPIMIILISALLGMLAYSV